MYNVANLTPQTKLGLNDARSPPQTSFFQIHPKLLDHNENYANYNAALYLYQKYNHNYMPDIIELERSKTISKQ